MRTLSFTFSQSPCSLSRAWRHHENIIITFSTHVHWAEPECIMRTLSLPSVSTHVHWAEPERITRTLSLPSVPMFTEQSLKASWERYHYLQPVLMFTTHVCCRCGWTGPWWRSPCCYGDRGRSRQGRPPPSECWEGPPPDTHTHTHTHTHTQTHSQTEARTRRSWLAAGCGRRHLALQRRLPVQRPVPGQQAPPRLRRDQHKVLVLHQALLQVERLQIWPTINTEKKRLNMTYSMYVRLLSSRMTHTSYVHSLLCFTWFIDFIAVVLICRPFSFFTVSLFFHIWCFYYSVQVRIKEQNYTFTNIIQSQSSVFIRRDSQNQLWTQMMCLNGTGQQCLLLSLL